jgi:hypothetical protein
MRGKPDPVTAYRLVTLDPTASGVARQLDRPMVGRKRELERLSADFAYAAESRGSRLFTLIGPAGIGKSRIVADFLATVSDVANFAHGRALSYGDGITYWPLVEMLIQLGIEPHQALCSSPADTQLATRGLLEKAAELRPLILVFDDLQWAEPPMLDLIEHIADWSREAPLLLLCIARPELLDVRPGWGGGKVNATSVLLEPLEGDEAEQLATSLLADLSLDAETTGHILSIAEGNPLFLEEMAALAREAHGAVTVPPTIRALLQARLDTLNDAERSVIERGAVEGKTFHRGSVTALAPANAREGVPNQLVSLVRKELVRPERSQIAGDEAFRFRHLLIRDTAYDALPKTVRADLHERFADWVADFGDVAELDEIVGYHLEQAVLYLRELSVDSARADQLAARAGSRLSTAGLAAIERGDAHAVCNLLGRAVHLLPHLEERRRILPELVEGLYKAGRRSEMAPLIEELERGSEADKASAFVLRVFTDPGGASPSIETTAHLLEMAGQTLSDADAVTRARYERARHALMWLIGDAVAAHEACRRAYLLSRSVGRKDLVRDLVYDLLGSANYSGASMTKLRQILADVDEWVADEAGPLLAAGLDQVRGDFEFFAGTVAAEEQLATATRYMELLTQTGSHMDATGVKMGLEDVAWAVGDMVMKERLDREAIAELEGMGDRNYLVNAIATLALTTSRLGKPQEALEIVTRGRDIGNEEDVADQILLDLAQAHAQASAGHPAAGRAALESAMRRAAGIRMTPLDDQIAMVEGELEVMAGNLERAAEIADRIASDAHDRGFHRYAEALRRTILDAA